MAYTRVQMRRGAQSEWDTNNPTLAPGEIGLDLTNGKIKIGNGTSTWLQLTYFTESAYELAKKLGFVGTEQQWLLSLVGPTGTQGEVGPGLAILGSFVSLEALESAVTDPNVGDAYSIIGELYTWNGSSWVNVGPILVGVDSPLPLIFATAL